MHANKKTLGTKLTSLCILTTTATVSREGVLFPPLSQDERETKYFFAWPSPTMMLAHHHRAMRWWKLRTDQDQSLVRSKGIRGLRTTADSTDQNGRIHLTNMETRKKNPPIVLFGKVMPLTFHDNHDVPRILECHMCGGYPV